jgi:hypothetical protein
MKLSATPMRCAGVALSVAALAMLLGACSADEGRSREDDTTQSGLQPGGDSSYGPGSSGGPVDPETVAPGPGAEGATDEAPVGTGPNLIASNGWVDGASNGLGIQGALFTYQDGTLRTEIAAVAEAGTGTGYCVSGSVAEVLNMDFSGTWGAVAALNLNQAVGSEAVGPYDAAAHAVVGFGFDIVGDTAGALRFVVKQHLVHDGFCINNVPSCGTGCSVEFLLEDLTQNCWTPGGATPDPTSLSALEWQITAKAGSPTPFDYCIENIHAVLAEAPASDTVLE